MRSRSTGKSRSPSCRSGPEDLSGSQVTLQIQGTIAEQQRAVAFPGIPNSSSIRDIYPTIDQAPAGADFATEVRVGGTLPTTLTILDGQTVRGRRWGFG